MDGVFPGGTREKANERGDAIGAVLATIALGDVGSREGIAACADWRADVHYLPKPIPQPPNGFVTTRCPKCQRLTSYLSFQGAPVVMCAWTNCGHTWIESQQRLRDSDE